MPDLHLSRAAQLAWKITLGGSAMAACATTPDAVPPHEQGRVVTSPVPTEPASPAAEPSDAGVDAQYPMPRNAVAIYGQTVRVFRSIVFRKGEAALRREHDELLDAVVEVIRVSGVRQLLIEGRAEKGEANPQRLSERRAMAVAKGLADRHVPKEALQTRGLGASSPVGGADENERSVRFTILEVRQGGDAGAPAL